MKKKLTSQRRKPTFQAVMTQARSHMNPAQRAWSHIIHLRPLDSIAGGLAASLARPLPLLCGALGSILTLAALYGTAKLYGYTTSGAEGLIGFIFGWLIGMFYDLIRAMIRGSAP
jgi:hypothetical protein